MRSQRLAPVRILILFASLLAIAFGVQAYEDYSTNQADNCATCHGDFRDSPYNEQATDGGTWVDGLHDTHQDFVSGDCNVCHSTGGRFPVILDSSRGGAGLSAISCVGCHRGAGTRQHHWNSDGDHAEDLKVCLDCHADSDPGAFTPAGEDTLPVYYAEDGGGVNSGHVNIPSDPCSPGPAFVEDLAGAARGLDNDGDLIYDMADPDCSGFVPSPGETSLPGGLPPLLVTGYNSGTGDMTVDYTGGCQATAQTLIYGTLTDPFGLVYTGEECGLPVNGPYVWASPAGSYFFLTVGNNGAAEGSYGQTTGVTGFCAAPPCERPDDAALPVPVCPLPQDLPNRCD